MKNKTIIIIVIISILTLTGIWIPEKIKPKTIRSYVIDTDIKTKQVSDIRKNINWKSMITWIIGLLNSVVLLLTGIKRMFERKK